MGDFRELDALSDNKTEAALIATLVHHPEFVLHSEYLKPNYFYQKENGCIYWAISELFFHDKITNIDAFNISNKLNSNLAVKKKMESVNMPDMDDFLEMCEDVARSTIEEYNYLATQVATLSFKRELFKKLEKINKTIIEKPLTLSDLNGLVYDELEKLTSKYMFNSDLAKFGEKAKGIYQEIKSRRGSDGFAGITSKYSELNSYFTYENGELVMVSGRMKMGKSAFMLNEATDKIKKNIPTVYFDTEMNDRLFYTRLLANLTGIPQDKIKNGGLLSEEEQIIDETNEWLKNKPFVHLYIPSMTCEELYVICKTLKYSMNLQFVVYDYFKSDESDSSKQYNDLGAKCDFIKNRIAGELDVAVLAGAQLNRSNEIADSDKLERYASVSIGWRKKTDEEYRTDGEECGNYALNVRVNRLGENMNEGDYADFKFNGAIMQIEQAEKHSKNKPI